ncbi:hypothetical protein HYX03_00155 [Candidatus Woesearchaeota archaeon]|nr:hypothetical protein [Candidatus Woesearchaeota archaeon]
MKHKKIIKNKSGESFGVALAAIFLSISIFSIAFISEGSKITGFAVKENVDVNVQPILVMFKDVNSLSTLAAGNYYIDSDGIVYWMDDESKPAIAKVNFVDESQKNRQIYIDDNGRVGYVLNPIS